MNVVVLIKFQLTFYCCWTKKINTAKKLFLVTLKGAIEEVLIVVLRENTAGNQLSIALDNR